MIGRDLRSRKSLMVLYEFPHSSCSNSRRSPDTTSFPLFTRVHVLDAVHEFAILFRSAIGECHAQNVNSLKLLILYQSFNQNV